MSFMKPSAPQYIPPPAVPQAPPPPPPVLAATPAPKKSGVKTQSATFLGSGAVPEQGQRGQKTLLGQ